MNLGCAFRHQNRTGANMELKAVYLVFVVSFGVCAGHYYRLTQCPKVLVKRDFVMDKFLGEWYVMARFNPLSTCTKINVEKTLDDVYQVNETSRLFGWNVSVGDVDRKRRKLTILSNGTDAIFKITPPPYGLKTFGIVDTDYDNYAAVWACEPTVLGSLQNLDIMSRKPEIDRTALKMQIKNAEQMGINVRLLERVYHVHCSDEEQEKDKWSGEKGINNMFVKDE